VGLPRQRPEIAGALCKSGGGKSESTSKGRVSIKNCRPMGDASTVRFPSGSMGAKQEKTPNRDGFGLSLDTHRWERGHKRDVAKYQSTTGEVK